VKKNRIDEARDTLQATVLSHVPVSLSFSSRDVKFVFF